MAASDYRTYLRNNIDMENGQPRFHAAQSATPTNRLIFGTLVVMGVLQVASSVAILLHLTGYLREVDFSLVQQTSLEDVQTESIMADALKSTKRRDKTSKRTAPSAHLPMMSNVNYSSKEAEIAMILWDTAQGRMTNMTYHDGRIVVEEKGYYYVYAKTCFRYVRSHDLTKRGVSNVLLIQYIYHEKVSGPSKSVLLTKSGGTLIWNSTEYNMYCLQQSRGVKLSKGDGIFLMVSEASFLDKQPEASFFGALKMSN